MPRPAPASRAVLVGGAAALAAPAVMWSEFLAVGLATPGYNLLTRAASDLGARGAPHAGLFVPGFFWLAGVLTLAVGGALALAGRTWSWRAGAVLVAVEGGLLVALGAFPEVPGSPGATGVHQSLATVCFGAAALAPLVLAAAPAPPTPVGPPRGLWVATGAVLVLLLAVSLLARPAGFQDGLFQRPFGLVLTGWFAATGVWLLRSASPEG